MYGRSHGVGGCSLGSRAKIELDTGRDTDLEKLWFELDAPPSRREVRDGDKAPVTGADGDERAVVAGEPERAADGGIDESTGAAGNVDREHDGAEETPRNTDRLARTAVQGGQLRILPETAGKEIDLAEPTDELAASTRKRCRVGDADDCAGPERAKSRGGGQEPPETTAGGDRVAAGAGAGAGAGGDAAPSFPGPGAAGRGGIAVVV